MRNEVKQKPVPSGCPQKSQDIGGTLYSSPSWVRSLKLRVFSQSCKSMPAATSHPPLSLFSATLRPPTYAGSISAISGEEGEPWGRALKGWDVGDTFYSLFPQEEKLQAVSLTAELCHLGGGADTGKVKSLLLSVSKQLFLALCSSGVLQLPDWNLEFS